MACVLPKLRVSMRLWSPGPNVYPSRCEIRSLNSQPRCARRRQLTAPARREAAMRRIKNRSQTSRREFLEGTGVAIVAAAAAPTLTAQTAHAEADVASDPNVPHTKIRVTVNGKP